MQIENATKYRFAYNKDEINVNKSYTVDIHNAEINMVLDRLFSDGEISYSILDRQIVLKAQKASIFSTQQRNITGKVLDSSGQPLPGATVVIKGTTKGTVTDENGNYNLSGVSPESTLVFSFVGMTQLETPVSGRSVINVTLQEEAIGIEEVVAVGYGSQTKRDLTGAITNVNKDEIMEKQPVRILDALQGAVPGVLVVSDTGEPGEEGSIRIRGASTVSDDGASPLYILDGVQVSSIESVNPNDIESINILKDAASASIYGSRSANGVVLITTKSGTSQKPRVELKYLSGLSQLSHKIPQGNRLEREILERYNSIGLYPGAADSTLFSKNADNYYIDYISQNAIRSQIDAGISGGSPQFKYRANVQYLDDEGIIINSFYKRLTSKINVTYNGSNKLMFNTNISFSYSNKSNTNEGGVFLQAFQRPPHYALYFPDGSYAYNIGGRLNPVADAILRKDESKLYNGLFFQAAEYKIADWLTLHGDISATVNVENREYFVPSVLVTTDINSGYDQMVLSILTQGNAYLTARKTFNKKHNLGGTLGASFEKSDRKTLRVQGTEFLTEAVQTANAISVLDPKNTYSTGTANSLVGFFGRLEYNYKHRYIFNTTFRADGSSRFGSDNRWGYFPSASIAWRFSDESFMSWLKNIELTDAKFRVSVGRTGNQAIGNFDAQTEFVFGSYSYNGVGGITTSSRMGNSLLKWEETDQVNMGLDLMFLKGRINFVGDYYVKNTRDLLYDVALPYETGYNTVRTNLGGIQNKGLEFSLTWRAIKKKNFSWTTSVNWSANRNKITDLPEGNRADDIWWIGEGYEAGSFYGWKQSGVYAYDESNAWTPDFKTRLNPVFERDQYGNVILDKTRKPNLLGYTFPDGTTYTGEVKKQSSSGSVLGGGDLIWQELPDENGIINGEVGNEDRQILGKGHPEWFGGWSNQFSYKGITFSFIFYGSFGNYVYNEAVRSRTTYATTGATPRPHEILNFWKYPGQITDSYRRFNFDGNTRRGGDLFLEDASFIRLQNVRLGYRLNQEWLKKTFMNDVQFTFTGNNLLTWTNYTGCDPEVSQTSILKPGNDNGRYPKKRTFSIGVNVSF
ncbi:MAG: TonB-dependent receptor [Mangrovibacterium sp.]